MLYIYIYATPTKPTAFQIQMLIDVTKYVFNYH